MVSSPVGVISAREYDAFVPSFHVHRACAPTLCVGAHFDISEAANTFEPVIKNPDDDVVVRTKGLRAKVIRLPIFTRVKFTFADDPPPTNVTLSDLLFCAFALCSNAIRRLSWLSTSFWTFWISGETITISCYFIEI